MILPYDINFYGVFLTKTKVVPLPVFSKYWCFLNWYKISNILKKCKATTLVLVENTSYQWYYRVKSIVWSILIKITAVIEYSSFYIKKPRKLLMNLKPFWATKIPLLHAFCHPNNQNTLTTQAKKIMIGYNFRGGAGPFFTQRLWK